MVMCGPMCTAIYIYIHTCGPILHSCICSLHVVEITAFCRASGFSTQGAQLWPHPEHCAGSDKTWTTPSTSSHLHEASSLQQASPSLSPRVPRYLLSDPHSLIPTDGNHREAAAQAVPVWWSLRPDPVSPSLTALGEHYPNPTPWGGGWGAPLMPTSYKGDAQLLLLRLRMPPPPQKGSLQVHSLFPPLCSTLNIYRYSIVQLPTGADKQIAKAHFFLERQKRNANDIHWSFWYVQLDAYQPNCTPGKEMAGLFSLSYMEFNKQNCETLCVTVKCNWGLHISRSKAGSLAKLKKVENCQRKHFCPA